MYIAGLLNQIAKSLRNNANQLDCFMYSKKPNMQ